MTAPLATPPMAERSAAAESPNSWHGRCSTCGGRKLAGVAQPLSGEWAARRSLLEELSVPIGYGVEIAVLIDTARRHGIDAIAQVDLGERGHSHQADADLAVMAAELMLVVERRRFATFAGNEEWLPTELVQFTRADGELRPRRRVVPSVERPPASSVLAGEAPR